MLPVLGALARRGASDPSALVALDRLGHMLQRMDVESSLGERRRPPANLVPP